MRSYNGSTKLNQLNHTILHLFYLKNSIFIDRYQQKMLKWLDLLK
jgi:hypothetical protein